MHNVIGYQPSHLEGSKVNDESESHNLSTVSLQVLLVPFLITNYYSHDLCILLWHADASQNPETGIAQRCEPSEDLPCHLTGSSSLIAGAPYTILK
jgi:hypothetical protein